MLTPRSNAPDLMVETLDHGTFELSEERADRFILICFYRGLHCPICAGYIKELDRQVDAFTKRGVTTIAISSDTQERSRKMAEKTGARSLRFGYGLDLSKAREWGLFISASRGKTSIGIEEPPLFSEPGVFLLRPDKTVYWLSVQSMPFARPNFEELVQALDFVVKNDYPARGEFTGSLGPT